MSDHLTDIVKKLPQQWKLAEEEKTTTNRRGIHKGREIGELAEEGREWAGKISPGELNIGEELKLCNGRSGSCEVGDASEDQGVKVREVTYGSKDLAGDVGLEDGGEGSVTGGSLRSTNGSGDASRTGYSGRPCGAGSGATRAGGSVGVAEVDTALWKTVDTSPCSHVVVGEEGKPH
ncbi:hypothetical protein NE237_031161 [Protea cynaroides]|uniref:Uncharacterized protein n=1 Tax=Protea cynaroides TaxID=273540 RepID=A0A9Q0R274_9MAGN|nr:hypothetical protein NE237_031161 [Protea cynaroides]